MATNKQRNILIFGLISTGVMHLVYLIIRWVGKTCQDPVLKQDFDLEKYMGLWYEFARSSDVPFETGECITAEYALDGGKVSVTNTQYYKDSDKLDSAVGNAYCSSFESGSCGVRFNFFQPFGNYDIVATDYTSYAIVYSCSPFLANAFCLEYLWVLSREAYDAESADTAAFYSQVLAIIDVDLPGYDLTLLKTTNQNFDDCTWVDAAATQ